MADLAELKKMLTEEVVHFVFEKIDGIRRDAYGTRAIDVIRKYDTGSTMQKPQRAFNGTFPYFDFKDMDEAMIIVRENNDKDDGRVWVNKYEFV